MADFRVTVEALGDVHPHPNADRLDVGQIGGYHVVLKKDAFKAGQRVVYIPEASILPEALIAHLGLTGRLAGAARNRVKAIRLRNVLSEGLVLPLDSAGRVENVETGETADPDHPDLAGFLGIAKWEPPIPTELAGEVMAAPFPLPSYDVEAWKRNPEALPAGTPCVATEKIHGTMVSITWFPGAEDEETYPWPAAMPWVASKGCSQKNLAFVPDAGTTYQRVAGRHADGLRRGALEVLAAAGTGRPWGVSWIGEIAGRGIQDCTTIGRIRRWWSSIWPSRRAGRPAGGTRTTRRSAPPRTPGAWIGCRRWRVFRPRGPARRIWRRWSGWPRVLPSGAGRRMYGKGSCCEA